jgi:caspase 10
VHGKRAGLNTERLYHERDIFYQTLAEILDHPNNRDKCANRYELLRWHDLDTPGTTTVSLEEFLRLEVARCLQQQDTWCLSSSLPIPETSGETFTSVKVRNVAEIYNTVELYPMLKNTPRGVCLIVDIRNFKGSSSLPAVRGSEHHQLETTEETGNFLKLEELFEKVFNFKVEVLRGVVTEPQLHEKMKELKTTNHSTSDAFVFCLFSYGQPGSIYSSDHSKVIVCDLAEELFDKNCPSLKGKPKLFFVSTLRPPSAVATSDKDPTINQDPGNSDERELERTSPKQSLSTLAASVRQTSRDGDGAGRRRDVIVSQNSTEAGELLVPPCPDCIMSFADLSTVEDEAMYIASLCVNLTTDVDIREALNNVAKQVNTSISPVVDEPCPPMCHVSCTLAKRLIF